MTESQQSPWSNIFQEVDRLSQQRNLKKKASRESVRPMLEQAGATLEEVLGLLGKRKNVLLRWVVNSDMRNTPHAAIQCRFEEGVSLVYLSYGQGGSLMFGSSFFPYPEYSEVWTGSVDRGMEWFNKQLKLFLLSEQFLNWLGEE